MKKLVLEIDPQYATDELLTMLERCLEIGYGYLSVQNDIAKSDKDLAYLLHTASRYFHFEGQSEPGTTDSVESCALPPCED
jgi:hypothetical protein